MLQVAEPAMARPIQNRHSMSLIWTHGTGCFPAKRQEDLGRKIVPDTIEHSVCTLRTASGDRGSDLTGATLRL